MRRVGFIIFVLAISAALARAGEPPGYADYSDWISWARVRPGVTAGMASSYDRSGGNGDYSHYAWPQGLIDYDTNTIVDTIQGPGVIYRFWMPHLTANRSFPIRMYFDGEPTPRIDTTSDEWFSGAMAYFASPLIDTSAGGQVSYEPIPFAKSIRIESANKALPPTGWSSNRHYYQYSYLKLPPHTQLNTFTPTLSPSQQAARNTTVALWSNAGTHPDLPANGSTVLSTGVTSIGAQRFISLASISGPGIIRRLNIRHDSVTNTELDGLTLKVAYDNRPIPAIEVPLAAFFGAGYNRAGYQSLPLGTVGPDGSYCFFPMPIRDAIDIKIVNTTNAPITIDAAVVEYIPGEIDYDLAYLHVQMISDVRQSGQLYHEILSTTGRGHYVGNLLYLEQPSYSFFMLEGDEVITVDGVQRQLGTGLEDAYNGGYYYNWVGTLSSEPEGVMPPSATRPLSGILHVHRELGVDYARADQYRWYIADRIPFCRNLNVKIENRYSIAGAQWTSVAFWYLLPDQPGDTDEDNDIDLTDFAMFQTCFGRDAACAIELDINNDGKVDLADYSVIQATLSGPC